MRTLAIGDIHGCRKSLESLADSVGFTGSDTIITLGDYVDRGDTKGVIDFLIELGHKTRLITLRGNHEVMMLHSRHDQSHLTGWVGVGGGATLESYGTDSMSDIPDAHWEFLDNTLPYHETESHFFVHANAYPDVPLKDQPDSMLYWEPFDNPPKHDSGKTMICGHTSQKSGEILDIGHAVCIDTFAYGGGWLTCMDVGSGVYWQTNEDGERRTDFRELTNRETDSE